MKLRLEDRHLVMERLQEQADEIADLRARLEEAEATIERMEKLGEQLADAWVVELDCEVSEVETVTVVLCRSCQRYVKDRDGRDTSHADDCIVAAWRESRVTRVEE